jgi:hypothetical protein
LRGFEVSADEGTKEEIKLFLKAEEGPRGHDAVAELVAQ